MLLVSSSGGVLPDLLALRPWWGRYDVSWVAVAVMAVADTLTTGGPDTVHLRLPLAAVPVPQQGDATEDEEGSDG